MNSNRVSNAYGVVGNPVQHSLSPQIHAAFAQQLGEQIEYVKIHCEIDQLELTLNKFFESGGRGLNITLPFKEQAVTWVGQLSGSARIAGAVNTISRQEDGTLGLNTDGSGLIQDLTTNNKLQLGGLRTLILGAGGASKGIIEPLLAAGAKLTIANRTPARADRLVGGLAARGLLNADLVSVMDMSSLQADYDLIINATSADALGETLHIPPICEAAVCYDLFYHLNQTTSFCRLAQLQKASRVIDGLGMLVEQAADAFEIWRGRRPKTGPVLSSIRESGNE